MPVFGQNTVEKMSMEEGVSVNPVHLSPPVGWNGCIPLDTRHLCGAGGRQGSPHITQLQQQQASLSLYILLCTSNICFFLT